MRNETYGVMTMGDLRTRNPFASSGGNAAMGELPLAASEGGTSNTDEGHSVGVATADSVTPAPTGGSLLDIFRPGGGTPTAPQVTPRPVAPAPAAAAPGMFGDLFGPSTDTIVIATGLLVLAGLAWMIFKKKAAPAPAARRRK